MTTTALAPLQKLRFCDNNGNPASGGKLFTYQAGTTTKQNTYTDSTGGTPNTNPIILDSRGEANVWLDVTNNYKFTLSPSTDTDPPTNPYWTVDGVSAVGPAGFKQSGTGAVTRTIQSKLQDIVSVLDFGADSTGSADCTAAIQAAINTGKTVFFPDGTYKMLGSLTYTGRVVLIGNGENSRIRNDGTVITVNSGTGSIIDNLYAENITAPWIITRNPATWAVPSVVQSNGQGYQPTSNDTDIWGSLTAGQQNQDIGPKFIFQGNASNITVSRITGRFVSVILYDAIQSAVHDCNYQAGKNFAGGIVFWNLNAQTGTMNAAYNNTIIYPSYSGIAFAANFNGVLTGNNVQSAGESGIKTWQNTINSVDARCYKMNIEDNQTQWCYYDGFDISSDYPHTGNIDSRHSIVGNNTFGNHGTGFYGDGQNNIFVGNEARACQQSGMDLLYNYSHIAANMVYDCNQSNTASGVHQILVNGGNNSIVGNFIRQVVANGNAIYATGTNYVSSNYAIGGIIYLGADNAVTATSFGNQDTSLTVEGTFTPQLKVGSTVQTLSTANGKFTRVGHRVFIDIQIRVSAAISGSGSVSITLGSLAAALNQSDYLAPLSIITENVTFSGQLSAFVGNSANAITLGQVTSGTTFSALTQANVTSTSYINISGSYYSNRS